MNIDQNSRNRPIHFLIRALETLNEWTRHGQIVEIGCMRQPCNHNIYDCSRPCCNDGHSTLFWLLSGHDITTCDIDSYSISMANSIRSQCPDSTKYSVYQDDGINFLNNYIGPKIDLLYLDGWDVGSHECAENHVKAYEASIPHLNSKHIILIDDTDVDYIDGECQFINGNCAGKGRLLIPMLVSKGYFLAFSDRQTMLVWDK